jgi:hypothetical protein
MTVLTRASRCARRLAPRVATDFSLVAQLLAWRCVLPLVKHVVTTATLARLMWWPPAAPVNSRDRAQRVALVKELMATGGRLLLSTNCLERSLVVYRLLSRVDADPHLVLGVRKTGGGVAGHAWVQLDGEALGERNAGDFDPIVAFGPDGVACQSPGLRLAS